MPNWEKWLCRGELVPRLQKLSIRNCPKLTGKLPEHLPSLEELEIYNCPHLLNASVTVNRANIRKLKMVDFGKLELKMLLVDPVLAPLQTPEIHISDVSQWKQISDVAPQKLSIIECDSVESLLEEEILQTNIQYLIISGCSFSRSLHKVGLPSTTLKILVILSCSKLEFLLCKLFRCHLPVLERLSISEGVMDDGSLSLSLGIFPKLTRLQIIDLEGLQKLYISIPEGDPTSLDYLELSHNPNLESIELQAVKVNCCKIHYSSKLRSLGLTHSTVETLKLSNCPELMFLRLILPSKLCELEIGDNTQLRPQVEWGLQRLTTSLTKLSISGGGGGGCEVDNMESFPEEHLLPSSLTSLSIKNLPNLKSLDSGGIRQLTSLLSLEIGGCPELRFSTGSGSPVFQHLISLEHLVIDGCPKLQSLTESGLQNLTSLEELLIADCPNLRYLTKQRLGRQHSPPPPGLQHLISLKYLSIYHCPMLRSLATQSLQHPTSLQRLYLEDCPKLKHLTKQRLPPSLSLICIRSCPLLEKRCQFEKGAEWPYISHVPKILINDELL